MTELLLFRYSREMDDGHFMNFGVVLGGALFFITSLAGGILFYFSAQSWRREAEEKARAAANQKTSPEEYH